MRILLYMLLFIVGFNSIHAEGNETLMKQYNFALKSKNHFEGFSKNIGKNEFTYHSLRIDVTDGLLTRCKNGDMPIEWLTQKIPVDIDGNGFWFTWLAAVQKTNEHYNFDVFVNDVKRFEFISGKEDDRKFENPDGGILEFTTIDLDQFGDAHGYMSLFTPLSWIKKGEPVKIKIVGEAAGSNTWIIVFKANDAVSYLQELVKYETWLNVDLKYDDDNSYLNFKAPIVNDGKTLTAKIGTDEFSVQLKSDNENAVGQLKISNKDIRNLSLIVRDDNSELISLSSLNQEIKKQKLLKKSLMINEVKIAKDVTNIFCKRIYKPHTVDNILKLSQSNLSKGNLYLMNSSHQDIAWMDSPEKCVIERDTMLLTPLFEKASNSDPTYRFDVEDALMLKEFISRHPDKQAEVAKLLQEGKISCGAGFIQPYEEMYSGEALVRQFYFGKRWLKKEFNYDARVYWNVDVPGKLLQMPQILKKSGVDYMVISRFQKGIYNWYSPDGSYVTTFSPGHYSEAFTPLHKNVYDAASYLAESSLDYKKYFSDNSDKNVIPVLSDWDMSPAVDYSNVIKNWESIDELEVKDGNKIPIQLPKFKIQTASEFLDKFIIAASNIPKIKGERPDVWLYIHGPSHYEALKASRKADILLTMAEKFSTINAMTENSFANYPSKRFAEAWESKIYPDHGWGGKEGQTTDDSIFKQIYFCKNRSSSIYRKCCQIPGFQN